MSVVSVSQAHFAPSASASMLAIRRSRFWTWVSFTLSALGFLTLHSTVHSTPLVAQSITVEVGEAPQIVVSPGERFGIPLRIDLSAAGNSLNLASLQGTLRWGPARLTFDSIRVNPEAGLTQTANTSGSALGSALISYFGNDRVAQSMTLATAWYTASATPGGTRVSLFVSDAGNEDGQSILGQLLTRALDVCVAQQGVWGDVNNDNVVSIIDAQQIARFSVNLSVANAAAVASRGDVNADGTVSIIDAQQIARFSVGLSASPRINTPQFTPPTIASLSLTPSGDQTIAVGGTLDLIGTPRDGDGVDVSGCVPVTWTTSDAGVATVTATGRVTGVAQGSATIQATSGSQSASVTVTVATPITGVVGAAGGTVASDDQSVGITLPPGALPNDVTVTLLERPEVVSASPIVGAAWTFGPSGTQFAEPATLRLRYPEGAFRTGTRIDRLSLARLEEGIWVPRASDVEVDPTTREVQGKITGFSTWGIWADPCIPRRLDLTAGSNAETLVAEDCSLQFGDITVRSQYFDFSLTETTAIDFQWSGEMDFTAGLKEDTEDARTGTVWGSFAGTEANGRETRLRTILPAGSYQLFLSGRNESQLGRYDLTPTVTSVAAITAGQPCNTFTLLVPETTVQGAKLDQGEGDCVSTIQFSPDPSFIGRPLLLERYVVRLPAGKTFNATVSGVDGGMAPTLSVFVGNQLVGQKIPDGSSQLSVQIEPTALTYYALEVSWAAAPDNTFPVVRYALSITEGASSENDVSSLQLVEGADLAVYPSVTAGAPVRVRALNAGGRPVVGAPLTLSVDGDAFIGAQGTERSGGAGKGTFEVVTNAQGEVVFNVWGPTTAPATGVVSVTTAGVAPQSMTVHTTPRTLGAHTCRPNVWTVECWGDNSRGQLGNGSTQNSTTPVSVSLAGIQLSPSSVVAQEGFGDHMCITDSNRAAWCWGSNTGGQLGDGTVTSRSTPVRVEGNLSFGNLVMGGEHTCGLTDSGEVWCWGYNLAGQLGDGTASNRRLEPVKVALPEGVVATAISAGTNHTCAGTATGDWYCWGLNSSGQLGDGTMTNRSLPTPVAGGPYVQIAAGEFHGCGRTASGEAFCWGSQGFGGLGNGSLVGGAVLTPAPVLGGHQFTYLYAGVWRTCAIKADFSVWCWGWNGSGQLGNGTLSNTAEPVRSAFTGYALRMGGTNASTSGQTTCALTNTTQQIFCWGSNLNGQLGTGGSTSTPQPLPQFLPRGGPVSGAGVPGALIPISPLGLGAAVIDGTLPSGAGQVRLVDPQGTPLAGQTITWTLSSGSATFSDGTTTATSVTDEAGVADSPEASTGATAGLVAIRASVPGTFPDGATGLVRHVFNVVVQEVAADFEKLSGDGVWLGSLNEPFSLTVPLRVRMRTASNQPIVGAPVAFIVQANSGSLSGGGLSITLQTDADGVATLPSGSWTTNTTPGSVSELRARTVTGQELTFQVFRSAVSGFNLSPLTSCELDNAGRAFCWGENSAGAVGIGSTAQANAPVQVSGDLIFTSLADGPAAHKCGLVGTTAYCWGENVAGQLGDGTTLRGESRSNVPTPVSGNLAFTQLAVGGMSTCGLTTSGALYCWGWSGVAGFGQGDDRLGHLFLTPVEVETPEPFVKVTLADNAVCGLTAGGTLWCRGDATGGWNLDDTFHQRTTWSQASGGPWKDVSAAYIGICALGLDDQAYCAGRDQNLGSLGTGTSINVLQASLQRVAGGITFASIHNYHFGACGRRETGEVWCWGSNAQGQTGTGTTGSVLAPTPIQGITFDSFRPMAFRTNCGKVSNGLVYCVGQNDRGQRGVGARSGAGQPTPVPVSGWPDGPAVGAAASMVIQVNPAGTSIATTAITPLPAVVVRDRAGTPVQGVTVTFAVTAGGGTGTGLQGTTDSNGIVTVGGWTAGPTPGINRMVASAPGLPSVTFQTTTVAPAGSIAPVSNLSENGVFWEGSARNPLRVVVRDANNQPIAGFPVQYVVQNEGANLGSGQTSRTVLTGTDGVAQLPGVWTVPGTAGVYTVDVVAAGASDPVTFTWIKESLYGGRNSCRLRADGQALCWGENWSGQVGDGTTSARLAPTLVAGGITFASLAEGTRSNHNCGLTAAGEAWCWGYNAHGELGDGTQTDRNEPVRVTGDVRFTRLFKGLWSTCGIATSGEAYCWGWTSRSRLGDGRYGDVQPTPRLVNTNGLVFTEMSLSWEGTCGLTETGTAHCWGQNPGENINPNFPRESPVAAPLPGLNFTQLSASDRGYCGVTTSEGLRCWGDNSQGMLGNGTFSTSALPVTPTGLTSGVAEVRHASSNAVCARGVEGEMWCWGSNGVGQLGIGSSGGTSTTPVRTGESLTFTAFHRSGSAEFFCTIVSTGGSVCWGAAPIGDGTAQSRPAPTPILWPEGTE
jgi:alpha-tubulin suppressor-like RCC1 family protein